MNGDIPRSGGSRTAQPTPRFRKNTRLKGYDYASAGYYFVTIVTADRGLVFRDPRLAGIVERCWMKLADLYDHVELDEYVVMPNHFHGIVVLRSEVDWRSRTPATPARRKPLGRIIGAFKTMSTKQVNQILGTPGKPLWQMESP